MHAYELLTDHQWQQIETLFIKPARRGRGKPDSDWGSVGESIFIVLVSNGKWSAIPKAPGFATKSVAHRWFAIWDKNGLLEKIISMYRPFCRLGVEIATPARRNRSRKVVLPPAPLDIEESTFFEEKFPFEKPFSPLSLPQEQLQEATV